MQQVQRSGAQQSNMPCIFIGAVYYVAMQANCTAPDFGQYGARVLRLMDGVDG